MPAQTCDGSDIAWSRSPHHPPLTLVQVAAAKLAFLLLRVQRQGGNLLHVQTIQTHLLQVRLLLNSPCNQNVCCETKQQQALQHVARGAKPENHSSCVSVAIGAWRNCSPLALPSCWEPMHDSLTSGQHARLRGRLPGLLRAPIVGCGVHREDRRDERRCWVDGPVGEGTSDCVCQPIASLPTTDLACACVDVHALARPPQFLRHPSYDVQCCSKRTVALARNLAWGFDLHVFWCAKKHDHRPILSGHSLQLLASAVIALAA